MDPRAPPAVGADGTGEDSVFELSENWQSFPAEAILPAGAQVELDMSTGARRARLAPAVGAHSCPVTIFPDVYAKKCERQEHTLESLANLCHPAPQAAEAGDLRGCREGRYRLAPI
jgi:hypothetical protein